MFSCTFFLWGYTFVDHHLTTTVQMPFKTSEKPVVTTNNGLFRISNATVQSQQNLRFNVGLYCLVVVLLLLIFSKSISGIFGCSAETAALVQHCIMFLVWGYLFNAVTQCFMGKINGYGQPGKGMIITVLNHIVIRIPFSIILSNTFLGLDGIWITLLCSFIIAFICAFVIDRRMT